MTGIDRRRFLASAAGTGLGLGVIGSLSSGVSAQDSGGRVEWTFETDGVAESSPTVVDGTVYIGSGDNNVYALDADSGEEEWSFFAGGYVASSPTVVDGSIYFGSRDDNSVYSLDAGTGREQWTFEIDEWFTSSPTVFDGTVYIGSWNNDIYALDAGTGEEEWAFETAGSISMSPTVVDGIVYTGSRNEDGTLYALDAASGEEVWSFDTGRVLMSSPTVADGTLYVGAVNRVLHALDAETGEEEWSFGTQGLIGASPTVFDGAVYVGDIYGEAIQDPDTSGVHAQGSIYAVDAVSGHESWSVDIGRAVPSSPTVAGDTLFAGDTYGYIHALDAYTGEARWKFATLDSPNKEEVSKYDGVNSSPTVVDGTVYIGSGTGTVYALDAGVDGSSEGSRVELGTLGHHEAWQGKASAGGGVLGLPGLGVASGLAGLGGAGYWLARRSDSDTGSEEVDP